MELTTILAIFLSISLYIFIPPILDGIERKIKANIQTRYGPSTIFQTWYDILKLMSKELIISTEVRYLILPLSISITLTLFLAIVVSFYVASTKSLLLPYYSYAALFLVTMISIHALHLLLYISSANLFSIIGTFRIISIDVANEVSFATFLVLTMVSRYVNSSASLSLFILSFIPLLIAVYVSSRRLPYDLHEAEPELASGSIIELSGPILGLYIYNHLLEKYLLTSIPVALIMLMFELNVGNQSIHLLFLHIFAAIIYMVFSIVSTILGRSRIDLAFKTLILIYSLAIIIWIGVYIFEQTL
ncbi:MAG: NADH-quinone oxidoreductase subunit H [Ignisphaera sp.]